MPDVSAAAWVMDNPQTIGTMYDLSHNIAGRQVGESRPFRLDENWIDTLIGSYRVNHGAYNWCGSDLSGGRQTLPGGIGDVNAPALNAFDAACKRHDIKRWLAAHFQRGCSVDVLTPDSAMPLDYFVQGSTQVDQEVAAEVCSSPAAWGEALGNACRTLQNQGAPGTPR